MITEKHLAIVRAALTFWDEEMASANQSTYKHYLHSADAETEFSPEDVGFARQYFNNIELKVALIDRSTQAFISESPVDFKDELSHQNDRQVPVAVFVPSSESRPGG